MRRSIIFLMTSLIVMTLYAQEEGDDIPGDASVNSQIWIDLNGKYRLDDKKNVSGFFGYRSIDPHLFDKFVLVPTIDILHLNSPKFMNLEKPLISSFHLGAGLFYTNNKYEADNFEFRLVQGMKFFLPSIDFVPLKTYIRLEERFQKTFDDSNWSFSGRIRLKVSTVIEWKKHLLSFSKGMYIPMSIEFFFNLKEAERYNDVIRISPGLGYKLNDEWKAEFFVSYHYSTNTSETEDSTNDFVFRLRIYKSTLRRTTSKELNTKEEDIKELID